jgi:hypothetical protein
LQTPKFEGLATIPADANGEPIFQAPWQAQIFATVIFLVEKGVLRLEEFRVRLHVEIESAIKYVDDAETYLASNYYRLWLLTLEALLMKRAFACKRISRLNNLNFCSYRLAALRVSFLHSSY